MIKGMKRTLMLLAALTVFVLMQALFRWTDKLFARIKH